jgi:transposase
MTDDLESLLRWIQQAGVTHVAMESTGVLWKPIWNVLEVPGVKLVLANAQELRQVPGRKSDVRDCQWIAHLLACGLITHSFVPARAQRELRDLTRYRACLEDERVRTVNRIHKVLEDANIKLGTVATDILGKSGRDMLSALARGDTDAVRIAEFARGKLKAKLPDLRRALHGHMQEHHCFLLRHLLQDLDHTEAQIEQLDARIAELRRPFVDETTLQRLDQLPGVNVRTIENVIAEIGNDMSQFPTAGHLSSWGGICPGNEASAGKVKRRNVTRGNRWLRRALVEAARAAARKKNSYFNAQYHRIASRRGANRAAMAVAHALAVTIYHLLKNPDLHYQDLGAAWFDTLDPERLTRHLVKRLEQLGFQVELKPKESAA